LLCQESPDIDPGDASGSSTVATLWVTRGAEPACQAWCS
jgi:hypothetical protein